MPILKPSQAKRKVKASNSLHYENETSKANDESGQAVTNNMSVDTLIDPEDYDAAGSTHFPNEDAAHPVLASKKKRAVKAAELEDPEDGGSTVDPTTVNVSTIPNDVDPDAGYIGASEDEDAVDGEDPDEPEGDDDDADFEPEDDPDNGEEPTEASVSGDELVNNMSTNSLEASEEDFGEAAPASEDPDWDPPPTEDDEDDFDDGDEDESGADVVEAEDAEDEPEDAPPTDEDLSILDVDNTPDEQVDDVLFATAGTKLMALKGNRVIATMTGRMAVNSGRNDVYLTDQFQEVTAMQLKASGLRRGLKQMGFRLATVNLASAHVLKAQVQKEVHKTTAAMRKVQAGNTQAMEQSLAIAAVGINRNMFKGVENELRASLEGEFRRMGIKGGNRIIAHAFAEHGPAYAKSILELANKISAMPEQVRDSYSEALDLNSDVMDEPDEDVIPIGAESEDFDDDIEEDFGEPIGASSVHASLARAGVPTKVKASVAANGKYSVNANAMLNGTKPMF